MTSASVTDRARLTTNALWAFIGVTLGSVILRMASAAFPSVCNGLPPEAIRAINWSISASSIAVNVVCVILVCLWIYAAHANLRSITHSRLEYTPGWAVGWYFVPVANLFKPFFAMQELWKFSQIAPQLQKNNELVIEIWWICWIVGNIATYISSTAIIADDLTASVFFAMELLGTAAETIAAFCLIRLITDITQAQASTAELQTAFA